MQYAAIRLAPDGEPAQVIATGKEEVAFSVGKFFSNTDSESITLVKIPDGKRLGVSYRDASRAVGIHVSDE